MLTVGTDTYISVKTANELVSQYYACRPQKEQWAALGTDNKESRLRGALLRIESMMFAGRKKDFNQTLEFPRYGDTHVPQAVKIAQMEEAIATIDNEAMQRLSLQNQGVNSVKLGNASESYEISKRPDIGALISTTAYDLLRPYLLGSAVIA